MLSVREQLVNCHPGERRPRQLAGNRRTAGGSGGEDRAIESESDLNDIRISN